MNLPEATSTLAKQAQIWALAFASLAIVFGAPHPWNFNPDSGVYIGSAISLLEDGRYWFNGHPNLLYYPGTSALLTIPLAVFGLNFHVMHVLFALLAVAALWLARAYFPAQRYGWTGLLLPLVLAANHIFQWNSRLILSDIFFLNFVLLSLLLWRKFELTCETRWFVACAVVVALSPMFRFHGLLLVGAFGIATLVHVFRNRNARWGFALKFSGIAGLTLLPFVFWTFRNYVLHTEDTFNMANQFFFGLAGLQISGQGFGIPDWIDADWKYPVYQVMFLFGGLGKTFFGELRTFAPYELVTAAVLGLIVMGGKSWLNRASVLEAVFVIAATALLVQRSIGGQSLYIMLRYWIPILPFFILVAGYGIQQTRDLLTYSMYRKAITVSASIFAIAVLALGAHSWVEKLSTKNTEKIASAFDAVMVVAKHVRNQVPPESIILATDWGVAPLLTGRRTYQVLRSSCDKPSLEIIRDKGPSYLVVFPGFLRSEMALAMAESYPQIFQQVFRVGDEEQGYFGAVYKINPDQVSSIISKFECQWEK